MSLVKRIRRKPGGFRASDQCQFSTAKPTDHTQHSQRQVERTQPIWDKNQCRRICTLEVGGLRLCGPHAGEILIEMALRGKLTLKEK